MNTLDGLLYFKIVLIVKFAMPYWVARSDTQIPLSYFAIISFLNSIIVRTTLLFTLLLSLTLLGHMVTYCTYLISGNKSKKNIHSTISSDVNNTRCSGKPIHTRAFCPSSPESHVTDHTGINMKGFSWRISFFSTLLHELGWEIILDGRHSRTELWQYLPSHK